MKNVKYDSFIIGQVSQDINIDYQKNTVYEIGGAVLYSGYAAAALGHPVCVLPKANTAKINVHELFSKSSNITVYPLESPESTSIENIYHTADKERRTCRAVSRITPYMLEEIPDINSRIYHLAGLMYGDISDDLISYSSNKAFCAVDVQCLLRHANFKTNQMTFSDWKNKKELLPKIHFLKTDAAEAEIMTGLNDRKKAAEQLYEWGAKEIMITHNTEVLVYDGKQHYIKPLRPRNLSGRSGRGDTCFSAYINERLYNSIEDALLTAAALTSMKMENIGPFLGDKSDVQQFIQSFYR